MERRQKENFAWILDYMDRGIPKRFWRKEPIPYAQAVGEEYFFLLELQVFGGRRLAIGQRVPLFSREEQRTVAVLSRIYYEDLTMEAKDNLKQVLIRIIELNEQRFIGMINSMGLITPKLHSYELLSGIGKNITKKIIEEREKSAFKSFEEFEERTGVSNIKEIIAERIKEELSTKQKYKLFVR
jgi:putative nucleotide binding protein